MQLRKYEKLWLDRLENPNMRKKREYLGSGKTCCCLGHACMVLELKTNNTDQSLDDVEFDFQKIRLNTFGQIIIDKITDKGYELLYEHRFTFHKNDTLEKFKDYIKAIGGISLVDMNDGGVVVNPMPHKTIAKFIRENKEAVLWNNSSK
jgi:hypothetical protein